MTLVFVILAMIFTMSLPFIIQEILFRRCIICKGFMDCIPIKDYWSNGSYIRNCYIHKNCLETAMKNPDKLTSKSLSRIDNIIKILSDNEKIRNRLEDNIKKNHAKIDWESMRSGQKLIEKLSKK